MSDFEFVSIVLSIVVGLAMTRILSGLASVLRHRPISRPHWVTLVWAVNLLLWLMVYWLGTVNSYRHAALTYTVASVASLLAGAVALYFSASLILPDDIDAGTDLEKHFAAIRRPFYMVLASIPLLELMDTISHGMSNLLANGWAFIALLVGAFATSLVGYFCKSRWVHGTLCLLSLSTVVGWLLVRIYAI